MLRSFLVLNELKETYLESVMIAVPNYARDLTVEKFMPLWRVIEDFIDKKKILSAAVCDFMLPLLSDFYDAAKVTAVFCPRVEKFIRDSLAQALRQSDQSHDLLCNSRRTG